jgi:uncharacterized protein (DUF924 family)
MLDPRARKVLDFWFGDFDPTAAYFAERNRLWFGGGAVDDEIRRTFGDDLRRAVAGELRAWEATPKGSLALIVILDQFSLNLYREQPESYRQSELALPIAARLIEQGLDRALSPAERIFVYLPYEHSEKIADQERSIALFGELAATAPPALRPALGDALQWAVRHWRVVQRYGRFPDRNEVFGRPSTPEEVAFLASDEAPF